MIFLSFNIRGLFPLSKQCKQRNVCKYVLIWSFACILLISPPYGPKLEKTLNLLKFYGKKGAKVSYVKKELKKTETIS